MKWGARDGPARPHFPTTLIGRLTAGDEGLSQIADCGSDGKSGRRGPPSGTGHVDTCTPYEKRTAERFVEELNTSALPNSLPCRARKKPHELTEFRRFLNWGAGNVPARPHFPDTFIGSFTAKDEENIQELSGLNIPARSADNGCG